MCGVHASVSRCPVKSRLPSLVRRGEASDSTARALGAARDPHRSPRRANTPSRGGHVRGRRRDGPGGPGAPSLRGRRARDQRGGGVHGRRRGRVRASRRGRGFHPRPRRGQRALTGARRGHRRGGHAPNRRRGPARGSANAGRDLHDATAAEVEGRPASMRRRSPGRERRRGVLRGIRGGARRGGARGGHRERRPARRAGVGAILRTHRSRSETRRLRHHVRPERAELFDDEVAHPEENRADTEEANTEGGRRLGRRRRRRRLGRRLGRNRIRKVRRCRRRRVVRRRRRSTRTVLRRALLPHAVHPAHPRRVRDARERSRRGRRRRDVVLPRSRRASEIVSARDAAG